MRSGVFFSGLLVLLAVGATAQAATLIPIVPVSGSAGTVAKAINNNNTITGDYFDNDFNQHGFVGSLAGDYTLFDAPDCNATIPRAINDAGQVIIEGCSGFERDTDGSITPLTIDGQPFKFNVPSGINKKGIFVGFGRDVGGNPHAYEGKNAVWLKDLPLPGSLEGANPLGVNNSMVVVGVFFSEADQREEGFIWQKGSSPISVNYPGAKVQVTELIAINDKGLVSGQWQSNTSVHAFIFDPAASTFKALKQPHDSFSQSWGLNNGGMVAFNDDFGSYIWCLKKNKCAGLGGVEIPDQKPIKARMGIDVKVLPLR